MANSNKIYTIGTSSQTQARLLKAVQHGNVKAQVLQYWSQSVKYSDFTAAATTEELDIHATYANNLILPDIIVQYSWIQRVTDFAGGSVTAATVTLGDTGDDNELVTALDVFTGAKATLEIEATPGAAHWTEAFQLESTYIPVTLLTTTTANINTLTAGEVIFGIAYYPLATIS